MNTGSVCRCKHINEITGAKKGIVRVTWTADPGTHFVCLVLGLAEIGKPFDERKALRELGLIPEGDVKTGRKKPK